MTTEKKVILGIDPGTTVMGYGVIEVINNKPHLVTLGVLELSKYTDHYTKLGKIFSRVVQIIESYHVTEMALEAPFFGKNVQSMLKLGRAQGVAMSAGLSHGLPIYEYAPLRIKQAITGQGNASKEQVALMLKKILKFDESSKYLDATDGLAAALCHHYQNLSLVPKDGVKSWKEFISKNPQRVKK